MPSLFQFSVYEFDVFTLQLTVKFLSHLSGILRSQKLFIFKKECNNGYLKKIDQGD